jgi:hypothetical protein
MNTQRLNNNYHDAQIDRFALGPRKDLTLFLHLDPVWNTSIARDAVIRFGAIGNYEEVEAFFAALPPPRAEGAFMAEVSALEQGPTGGWLIDVEGYGRLNIMSAKFIEKRR